MAVYRTKLRIKKELESKSKKQKCLVVVLAGQDFNLIDMSIDELHRLTVIELIGSNTVSLVCVMCMPAEPN